MLLCMYCYNKLRVCVQLMSVRVSQSCVCADFHYLTLHSLFVCHVSAITSMPFCTISLTIAGMRYMSSYSKSFFHRWFYGMT